MPEKAGITRRLAVIGHPLAAEENRLAFREWDGMGVDLILPATWKARSLGHVYRHRSHNAPGETRAGVPTLHALPVLASGRNSLFLWLGLEALVRKLKPDAIYCWEEPWCLSAWQVGRVARALGVPLVFYTAENRPKRVPWPLSAAMRAVFRQAAACVAPTPEIAATIRAAGFAGSILPVPLWIRPRRQVRADPEGRVLAYVGRLIPLKRVHLLVECLGLLPGYRLRIIGDGPERVRLGALAEGLGLAERVDFRGHVDNREIESQLDGACLLVLPTGENPRQAEQFGKAALEGVSCGLPVMASRTGNLALLARSVPTLAAADLDSAEQVAGAITARMEGYPTPAAREEARRQVQDRYGPAAAARRLEAAFTSLIAGGEKP